MKISTGLLCLAVFLTGSRASPLEQERSDVVAKLHEILAELESEDRTTQKSDGAELLEEIDISDMNLDDFKESGDEFILDSDKTADLLEEFRQGMANQGEVSDDERNDIILLNSQSAAQAENNFDDVTTEDIDNDYESESESVENNKDSSKSDGAELLEEIDVSDMNLDDFKESGDEFILDSDKTADLLEEFRQAMANQDKVSDLEKNDVILMRDVEAVDDRNEMNEHQEKMNDHADDNFDYVTTEDIDNNYESESESVENNKDSSKSDGAELLEEIDISDMNLDDFKDSGDEFILDSDKTADLLEEFRQAMASQDEVSDHEKNDVILMRDVEAVDDHNEMNEHQEKMNDRADDNFDYVTTKDIDNNYESESESVENNKDSSKSDGAELLEEIDVSDMNLDDFKDSGDEFILDSDKTADLLEEFRQAMANQGEVSDDERNDLILMREGAKDHNEDSDSMEDLNDEEIDELNLNTEQAGQRRIMDFEENKAKAQSNRNAAYPEKPDGFISEVLSDLNSEE